MSRKAVLLVNIGTPDQPVVKSVRQYLSAFLNDPRVIDIHPLARLVLVNGIIVPFRAPKSTRLYQKLWTPEGSPLLVHLNALTLKLQKILGLEYTVFGAMRYGNPALQTVLEDIHHRGFDEIRVVPLFPHYASSTTGSVYEYVLTKMRKWEVIPQLTLVGQFYHHPLFLQAFVHRIKQYQPERFDHILFSYHGLPVRQINKTHPGYLEHTCTCEEALPAYGCHCYKATCHETTRQLAEMLQLPQGSYTTSFQSRLSKNWLKPFTDQLLIRLAGDGKKKVLVVSPAFVADCLETIVEIGYEYQQLFHEKGGEELTLVNSLNSDDKWVHALAEIATK